MAPKVALVKCSDYNEVRVEEAVPQAVELAGGVERFIKPGERVFLKVNLLLAVPIERAVTTHPAVVKALVRLVQSVGAEAVIGDSPGGPYSVRWLKRVYRASGMDKVAEETGASLNFDVQTADVPHPEGKILKHLTIAKAVQDADAVITVPKLKTHGLMLFTGAVKNLFGVVPGLLKAEYHLRMPKVADLSDAMVDIFNLVKPRLAVVDGIVGMEGDGPSAGSPRRIGTVLVSGDGFACDVAGASLVGLRPEQMPITKAAMARGLTTGRLSDIELAGAPFEEIKLTDFKHATKGFSGDRMPVVAQGLLNRLFRPKPVLQPGSCTGCATCVQVCPPKAISMVGKLPQTDYDNCIRCFCCQELCPESAIAIWRPWAARRLLG